MTKPKPKTKRVHALSPGWSKSVGMFTVPTDREAQKRYVRDLVARRERELGRAIMRAINEFGGDRIFSDLMMPSWDQDAKKLVESKQSADVRAARDGLWHADCLKYKLKVKP